MIHNMHLKKEPFEKIVSGKKNIELRLYDEKRRKIKAGDQINFDCEGKIIKTKVINLSLADDFDELYHKLELDSAIYGESDSMLAYYNLERQQLYRVVGIEIRLIYKAGIDIGGTNVRCAVFDSLMNMADVYKVPTDQNKNGQENLSPVVDFLKGYEIESIGIGAPGPLDARKGKILNPPNLIGWDNFEIVDYFQNIFHVPVLLTNDVNVAGLAESRLGVGQGYESMYYITMSTGFGGAYVFRGELINGISTSVGEIHNMIVNEDKHHHKGTNPGCLNDQCGGFGLSLFASEAYGREVKAKELFELYHAGDPIALKIIEHAVDTAAKGIANIGCVIDPEIYIIGGSVAIYNHDYVEMIFEKAKEYYMKPEFLQYKYAKFEDDAGLIGAALLIE